VGCAMNAGWARRLTSVQDGGVRTYTLLPAAPEHADVLARIEDEAMRAYLEVAFPGWDDARATENFEQWMSTGRAQEIVVDDEVAGLYEVQHEDDRIWLNRIALGSRFRSRGIGSAIIGDLQQEAATAGVAVRLHVFVHNPAFELYRRLGFCEVGRSGPSIELEWSADGAT
jgi:ribosomal protein S18 acetylase RimI-like enzyme